MKNFFTLILMALTLSLSAQVVNTKQWTLIHERTATWCSICGNWGWDFKNKILNEFANKNVTFIALHGNGSTLENPTADAIADNFGGFGQPEFFVNGVAVNVSSGTQNAKLQEIKDEVEFNSALSGFAGVGMNAVLDDDKDELKVDVKVEFLEKVDNGNYSIGLYLLEDIVAPQASRSQTELHKNVLRRNFYNDAFGKAVGSAPIEKGKTYTETVILQNVTQKADKISVLGVIWNKVNGKFLFFNANEANVTAISPAKDIEILENFNAYANENGQIMVDINLKENMDFANIQLTDITGRIVEKKPINSILHGNSTINLDGSLVSGTYFVTLQHRDKISTVSVVIP